MILSIPFMGRMDEAEPRTGGECGRQSSATEAAAKRSGRRGVRVVWRGEKGR